MHLIRGNPGFWLLLILFSLGGNVPAGTGLWLLCIGCDDVGFTLTRTDAACGDAGDFWCGTTSTPNRDQQPEQLAFDERHTVCDCVGVPVNSHEAGILPIPSEDLESSFALLSEPGSEGAVLDLIPREASPRGPPDVGWSPATQTLFGQRTGLIL